MLYKLSRWVSWFRPLPINVTLSITNKCIARCKTCNIWKIYAENPHLKSGELTSEEWAKILQSIGRSPIWFTISGGNQFLRDDFIDIIRFVMEYCRPTIINIPVSGVIPETICLKTEEVLRMCKKEKTDLIMNLSLDGIGEKQDYIRGVKGDFAKTIETYRELNELKKRYDNFHIGVYTVVSVFNVKDIPEICDFVEDKLKPDNYMIEIAEQRKELNNRSDDIFPGTDDYASAVSYYFKKTKSKNTKISRLRQAMRKRYYSLIRDGESIPCYAAIASVQISPYGDVWPCCTRADVLGNLKEAEYDFRKIWHSKKSLAAVRLIRKRKCRCTHANPYYTNMLLHFKSVILMSADYFKKWTLKK